MFLILITAGTPDLFTELNNENYNIKHILSFVNTAPCSQAYLEKYN